MGYSHEEYLANKVKYKLKHAKYYQENKEKYYKNKVKWRAANRDRYLQSAFKQNLKRRFNLSVEAYQALFEAQNGKCAICKASRKDLTRNLDVDHCHKTGRIRGLLCAGCNVGFGNFKENVESLKSAIDYALKHNG